MRGPALQALCRELGDKHMVQALHHAHEAQRHMRLAEEQLAFVEAVRQSERRAKELRERIEEFAFAVDARLEQLRAKDGPRVDADELREEVQRRRAERDQESLARLLAGWRELCEHHHVTACTARQALEWLSAELDARARTPGRPARFDRLLIALEFFCPASGPALADVRRVAFVLREQAGRVVNGECLKVEETVRGHLWRVGRSAATQDHAAPQTAAAPRACAGGR